jgi:septal ring factor EnvC (AmiA/AmiB activator)
MSDEQNVQVAAEPAAVASSPESPAEKVFTQSEVEAMLKKRLAKFADYEDTKKRAARADELEQAQMTEMEKLTKQLEAEREKAATIEAQYKADKQVQQAKEVALKVAAELGVDATKALKYAGKLDGDDEETLAASAREFFEDFQKVKPTVPPAVNDWTSADPDVSAFAAGLGLRQ